MRFSFAKIFQYTVSELLHVPSCRVLGWLVWLSSVLVFFIGDLVFTVLIEWRKQHEQETDILEILRVVLLDGLFLVMGITLGVCIIVVSWTALSGMWTHAHACIHTHAHAHVHTHTYICTYSHA